MLYYKLAKLESLKNIIKNKKLYTFQYGGLDVIPESAVKDLNLQDLQLVESTQPVAVPAVPPVPTVPAVPPVPTVPTVPTVPAKTQSTLNPAAQEFTPGVIKTPVKSGWKVPPIIIPKEEASLIQLHMIKLNL